MGINQAGRGRATGLGNMDFSAKQEVRQAKQKVLLQSAGAELTNTLNSLQQTIPQRMQARQTVTERVKTAFWNSVGRTAADIAALNIRSPQPSRPHVVSEADISARKKAMVKEMAGTISNKLDSFPSVREKRSGDPAAAATYAKYLQYTALDTPEMPAFLNAMDDLRAAPTVKKAEAMLKDFIAPAKTDENGVPLEGQSRMQINLVSDGVRDALIKESMHSIAEAHVYDTPEKLQNLVKVFEGAERYIAQQLDRNCKFATEVNMAFNRLKTSDAIVSRFDPTRKA